MAYALPSEVEAYWRAVAGERLMPLRSEIDPMGFAGALDHAFIAERTAPGRTRIRLAGLWLTDAMGMEVRGMPLTAIFEPGLRAAAADAIDGVFTGPEILRMRIASAGRVSGALLLMPLRSDLGDVTRALGCIGAPSLPNLPRARFSIRGVERTDLLGGVPASSAMAEDQTPYAPPVRRRAHLRLVKG